MANLVSPGYKRSTLINQILPPVAERIIEFKGLNRKSVINEGEMRDMKNLTADNYPVLSPRKQKLGVIAIVDADPDDPDDHGVAFFYDGVRVTQVTGLTSDSRAVAINNKMCFFPQKTSVDITQSGVQTSTYKSLDVDITLTSDLAVTNPTSAPSISIATGSGLKYDDAITISGKLNYTPSGGSATTMDINISCLVEGVDEGTPNDTIYLPMNTFIEMIGVGASNVSIKSASTIKRNVPDLDYVVEWNNRLWGCNSTDNIIYASKLGDPTNWQYYQGTSLDSYYAQQGTDEAWTGIAEYSGHLLFFKPNSMTRVYGTNPSNFQITNTKTYGVEEASSGSILTINDTVFYKSELGIMAYQGGVPFCISDKINRTFHKVVAGTEGTKYYASCIVDDLDGGKEGQLMVFDIARGMWHKEDDLRFTSCCKVGDKIYYTTASAEILYCGTNVYCDTDLLVTSDLVEGSAGIINPNKLLKTHAEAIVIDPVNPPENYEDMEWMAEFGPFDEYVEEHKIYSKLALRLKANGVSSAKVYISINEGPWEQVEDYVSVSTKGDFIPIIPRRCDRYSVKIEGKGNVEMKSLTRRVRQGTFGRL